MSINWTSLYKKYKGKWVALKDDEKTVIASAASPREALEEARKKGYSSPTLHRVPSHVVPLVGGFILSHEVPI